MSQILRKMAASATLLMLPFTTAGAYCDFQPCYQGNANCAPCLTVGADLLVWKPCVDDLVYAGHFTEVDVEDYEDPLFTFKYKSICQKWEPGVRVFAKMPNCLCNWDAAASFTYVRCSNHAAKSIPFPAWGLEDNTFTSPLSNTSIVQEEEEAFTFDRVKADWKAKYFNPDLLLCYHIHHGSCLDISPYFGLAGLYLQQEMSMKGFSSEFNGVEERDFFASSVDWKSNVWGIGLKAGLSFEQKCSECISVFANGSASLLAGQNRKTKNTQMIYDGEESQIPFYLIWNFKDPSCCKMLPGYHIQAGFNYDSNMCGCQYTFRLGYEFVNWFNMPNPRIFASESEENDFVTIGNSTSPSTRNFGFHGLFLGFEAGF